MCANMTTSLLYGDVTFKSRIALTLAECDPDHIVPLTLRVRRGLVRRFGDDGGGIRRPEVVDDCVTANLKLPPR